MLGQGRPTTSSRALLARLLRATHWLRRGALAPLFLAVVATCALADDATLRLRIAWGGGAERVWQGAIALDGGTLSDVQALGIEADEPGSIWIAGSDRVEIRQRSLRAYDGVDVTVSAARDARLSIHLSHEETPDPQSIEVSIGELIDQPYDSDLDDVGNRLSVSRSPGDRLRIEFDREHLVFAPGEPFTFQVEPHLIGASTSGLRLQAQITRSPGGQRVWSKEYTTGDDGTDTTITLPVPQGEGVYDLTLAMAPSSRIKQRFGLQRPVVQRKVQFIVLAPEAVAQTGEAPTARVVEINPVNPRWWERFANLPLIPGFRQGPLGNGDSATWNHPVLGPMVQLGPHGTPPDISWEAYPLPINHPGQVHVLEVEYPSDVPQAMGISLLEPNAAGAVMPIGLDSGVYVSDEEAESPPRLARHRIVFWPKTKTPLVLITNRREGAAPCTARSPCSAPRNRNSRP